MGKLGLARAENLVGKRFGRLVVLQRAGLTKCRSALWLCRCDCGSEKSFPTYRLNSGDATACGCQWRTVMRGNKYKERHGFSQHPLYNTWHDMFHRCNNQKRSRYNDWGGRGIKVCKRWLDPWKFVEDMGPKPRYATLDRKDNDGDYKPSNCRWATRKEQNRNTRTNRLIEFRGQTKPLGQWAEETGINEGAIRNRLDVLRWSVEKALTTPISSDHHRRGLVAHRRK